MKQKRIHLTHGTARVSENVSKEVVKALNKMSVIAYDNADKLFMCACKIDNGYFTDENGINFCKHCEREVMLFPPRN